MRRLPGGLTPLLSAGLVAATALLPAAAASAAGPDVPIPHFVDETKSSKLKNVYAGDWQYFVGGGVATFDCDGDHLPEVFLAGGKNPASLWHNDSTPGGALRFSRVKSPVTDLDAVTGAYPIDIDSDGITDLVVMRVGEDVLLRGLGGCVFERANETWGFDGGNAWTTAFSATWEGANALPTLAFGTYVDLASSDQRIGNCGDGRLVRPKEAGTGYDASIPLTPGFCSLSMLFSDWGRTGRRDLRVSNDRHYAPSGEEQLWKMLPGEAPALYTEADGWQKLVIWGMGIASRDLTGDGKPEVYLTSQGDNKLQTLVAGATGPTYEDIALARKATATRPFTGGDPEPSTSWTPAFEDINNDGLVDLFIAKGNVEAQPGYALKDPSDLLLQQPDGTFAEAAKQAGLLTFDKGRGAAVVDLNDDGLLDVVEVMRTRPTKVWRNVGSGSAKAPAPMGGFVSLELQQPAPNPDAIGAWIEVQAGGATQTREVTIGGGHASGDLGPFQFGVGDATDVQVRVTWPDGEVGPWQPVTPGGRYTIERGATAPTPREPSSAAPGG
ncbi:MAG: CRTAC1 family protein [Chloroflexota bacterium]